MPPIRTDRLCVSFTSASEKENEPSRLSPAGALAVSITGASLVPVMFTVMILSLIHICAGA